VLALRASFRPDALPGLDEVYELRLGAETFAVAVRDATVETARGAAPGAALVLRADPVTLVALLRAELTAEQATASGALEVEGRRGALVRFMAAFAWR
jgi:putative sterol carrier protein